MEKKAFWLVPYDVKGKRLRVKKFKNFASSVAYAKKNSLIRVFLKLPDRSLLTLNLEGAVNSIVNDYA